MCIYMICTHTHTHRNTHLPLSNAERTPGPRQQQEQAEEARKASICMYIYIYICIDMHIYIHTHIYIYIYMYIYIYIYIQLFVYVYLSLSIYIYICIHICIHILKPVCIMTRATGKGKRSWWINYLFVAGLRPSSGRGSYLFKQPFAKFACALYMTILCFNSPSQSFDPRRLGRIASARLTKSQIRSASDQDAAIVTDS